MSWKYYTAFSNVKHPNDRSRKECVCGFHNAKNVKKNKNHHSTKQKLSIKEARKEKEKIQQFNLGDTKNGYRRAAENT